MGKGVMTAVATDEFLKTLGIEQANLGGFAGVWMASGPEVEVVSPIDGSRIATVRQVTEQEYDTIVDRSHHAYLSWRAVPAPPPGTRAITPSLFCGLI